MDIPKVDDCQAFTKLFGQGAIYGITLVTEETAILKAGQLKQQPMNEWDVRHLLNLPSRDQQRLEFDENEESDPPY